MNKNIYYYKNKHKVKILTKTNGYLIVEALEKFEDTLNSKKIIMQIGEKRIIPTSATKKSKPTGKHIPKAKKQSQKHQLIFISC
ncbi:MAG: hypothetical protein GX638_09590 [Crenarchaeota archaeon]|nr:hypothetical protein [Thermoproteota archaeon]